jgi:hypothetical protein
MSIITSKFYANQAIDTFQGAKTAFLKNVVAEDKFRAPLQSFVDAQTSFAKEMVRIGDEIFTQSVTYLQDQAKVKK